MLRNIAEPGNAGGFEGHGRVKPSGNSTVDDDLLLFVEQRNHLALCPYGLFQLPVCPIQKTNNRNLFAG